MSDTASKSARRKLLKTLTAGGLAGATIPGTWTPPVVSAVILPAHAQTSGGLSDPCSLINVDFANGTGNVAGFVVATGAFSPAGVAVRVTIEFRIGGPGGTFIGGGVVSPDPVSNANGNYAAFFNFALSSNAGDYVKATIRFVDQNLSTDQTICEASRAPVTTTPSPFTTTPSPFTTTASPVTTTTSSPFTTTTSSPFTTTASPVTTTTSSPFTTTPKPGP